VSESDPGQEQVASDVGAEAADTNALREAFADAFDRSADPLAEFSDAFHDLPDPFAYFIEASLQHRESISRDVTIEGYRRTYRQWRDHMESVGRHPACPNPGHVSSFIEWRRDVHGNTRKTIAGKLNRLSQAYEFWQADGAFPHPADYNPFTLGKETTDLGDDPDKELHDLSLEDLREVFAGIENIRRRAIIGLQLKTGARAGEVCNMQLQDVHLPHEELQQHYDQLGTHPALAECTDALYIPHDRKGNKSSNPRLLPVDDELRWLLLRYLLVRPQVGEPWLFLSERTYSQLSPKPITQEWKGAFHPEYGETEDKKPVTSHFGRHWFSSYWRLEVGLAREHVQYMRGDRVAPLDEFPDAIDDYLHPNYTNIERQYRISVFKLNLNMRYR
jgi:integrase/recombinase XerD